MAYFSDIVKSNVAYPIGSTLYGTCETGASTVKKVVTLASYDRTLANSTGVTIHVKFTYSNTATNPTLEVNGITAAPIYRYGTTAAGTTEATSWIAGSIVEFTYDGSGWVINNWLNTDANTTYSANNGLSFDSNRKLNLTASGASAGSYGPSAAVTGNEGTTVPIPRITVDTYGRVTSITSFNLTCKNTDDNTTYTAKNGLTIATGNKLSLAASGATAGSYGPSAAVTGSNGTTVPIPRITVDTYGRVTSITSYNLTCVNTDDNTTYTGSDGISVASNKVSLATSGATAGSYGPSAAVTGSNGTAVPVPGLTVDGHGRVTAISNYTLTCVNTDDNTTYSGNNGISVSSNTVSLATSGATAGSYGPSAAVTGNNGTTVSVPGLTVDGHGRVTAIANYTLTCVNTDENTTYTGANGLTIETGNKLGRSASGAAAGSYGPSAAVTGSNGTTVPIPRITVDTYGRVTAIASFNLTCVNTDDNTTYTAGTGISLSSSNVFSLNIADNCTTTTEGYALSANQGKLLYDILG